MDENEGSEASLRRARGGRTRCRRSPGLAPGGPQSNRAVLRTDNTWGPGLAGRIPLTWAARGCWGGAELASVPPCARAPPPHADPGPDDHAPNARPAHSLGPAPPGRAGSPSDPASCRWRKRKWRRARAEAGSGGAGPRAGRCLLWGHGGEVRPPRGAPGEIRGEHPAARHHRQRLPAQQPGRAQPEAVSGGSSPRASAGAGGAASARSRAGEPGSRAAGEPGPGREPPLSAVVWAWSRSRLCARGGLAAASCRPSSLLLCFAAAFSWGPIWRLHHGPTAVSGPDNQSLSSSACDSFLFSWALLGTSVPVPRGEADFTGECTGLSPGSRGV